MNDDLFVIMTLQLNQNWHSISTSFKNVFLYVPLLNAIVKWFIFIMCAVTKPKCDACVVWCNINSISVDEIRRAECFLSKFDLALLF